MYKRQLLPLPSSGLGYIAGSKVKDVAGDWHWALRVSLVPACGKVSSIVTEPPFYLQTPHFKAALTLPSLQKAWLPLPQSRVLDRALGCR